MVPHLSQAFSQNVLWTEIAQSCFHSLIRIQSPHRWSESTAISLHDVPVDPSGFCLNTEMFEHVDVTAEREVSSAQKHSQTLTSVPEEEFVCQDKTPPISTVPTRLLPWTWPKSCVMESDGSIRGWSVFDVINGCLKASAPHHAETIDKFRMGPT